MANLAYRESMFDNLFDFRRDFDQLFNRLLTGSTSRGPRQGLERFGGFMPEVSASVDSENKKFRCQIALAGVDPKDVNIQVQGNVLSIRGERKLNNEIKDANYVYNEMAFGSFERDIALPDGVEPDKLSAQYTNGVLEITAPISAAALPRRIEIKGVQASKQAAA